MESNHRTQLRRLPLYPLSYGAGSSVCRGPSRVTDGTRTHNHRDHNPGLYQLSYGHRDGHSLAAGMTSFGAATAMSVVAAGVSSIRNGG